MAGYPNLFPAGFVEFDDTCSGPLLYRNQPSRENSYAPTLNDFMNKYSNGNTNYNFLRTLENLKFFSRHWRKIPQETKDEILNILQSSTSSGLGKAIQNNKIPADRIEQFTPSCSSSSSTTPTPTSSTSEIVKIIVTFIVAVLIGYMVGTLT
jgi:hypothetical protein